MFENTGEIVLKVTRDCNLRCKYCYIKNKDKYKGEQMGLDTFQHLIDRLVLDRAKSLRPNLPDTIQIIFHGGEPTLLTPTKLAEFIAYANQKIPKVEFGMQTNMTNLNQEWIDFFKKYQITPGVSIDGWTDRDNTMRAETMSLVNKLDILKKSGVGYGALMVLTKNNIKKFLLNYRRLNELLSHEIFI